MAADHIGPLRGSDDDVQERHSYCDPHSIGNLRGSENSAKQSAQGGRVSIFYSGIVVDGADTLLVEEE